MTDNNGITLQILSHNYNELAPFITPWNYKSVFPNKRVATLDSVGKI